MSSATQTIRQVRREAIADALTLAAERAIGVKGYDNTTMQEIAREAGCASGTIYLYFKSKEDLFRDLVRKHAQAMSRRLIESMEGVDDPLEKIRRNTRAFIEYFNANRTAFRVFYTAQPGQALLASGMRDSAFKEYLTFKSMEGELVRKAQRAGQLRKDIPADELLEFMHSLPTGMLTRWSLMPDPPSPAEQFRLLWAMLMGGMQAREAAT